MPAGRFFACQQRLKKSALQSGGFSPGFLRESKTVPHINVLVEMVTDELCLQSKSPSLQSTNPPPPPCIEGGGKIQRRFSRVVDPI